MYLHLKYNGKLACHPTQVDLHGMLVEEALEKLAHQLVCCGGLASGHPEGVLLRVIVGG